MGCTGFLARTFLYLFSNTEVHGLDNFLAILNRRKDESKRERGLITVSNHLSVYVLFNVNSDDSSLARRLLIWRIAWTTQ